MDSKIFFDNFETIANAPDGISRVRKLILELAMNGSLSLGSDRSKWVASTFTSVGSWIGGNGFPTEEQGKSDGEILFCKVSDMNLKGNEKYITHTMNTISSGDAVRMKVTVHEAGSVIFPKIGGAIATNKRRILVRPTAIDNNCMGVQPSDSINSEWLYLLLKSIDMTMYQSGTSLPSLSQKVLNQIVFSVPPREEQELIVSKVDDLMSLCDELESAQTQRDSVRAAARMSAIDSISMATTQEDLDVAWTRICSNWMTIADTPESISSLRSLILDLAIRGSLVDGGTVPDASSDVASSMREQRLADFQMMNRTERKKRVSQREHQDVFPSHWERTLLGDVCLILMGNSPPGDSYRDVEVGVPLINGPVEFSKPPLGLTLKTKFTTAPTYMCKQGDILVCVRGATTGRTNISGFDACIGRGVALVRGYESQDFINLFMWTIGSALLAAGKGTIFPSISYEDLANLVIGIPPLAEQKQIVARVHELMSMCDELESSLQRKYELMKQVSAASTAALVI